ncbi:MAG: presqualene diphosphate synthase HpnD [Aestuariivirgaceae bacterium]
MSSPGSTIIEPHVGADDQAEIARQVRAASTSFYGAMRILGRSRREAIFAVYAFCRAVDDIADDESIPAHERRAGLARWRHNIDALFAGAATDVIGRALCGPVQTYGLKREDFVAIIDGMQMDADGPIVAPNGQQLDLYCDRVASAVGRLCVCIFGEPGDAGRLVAQHLGRALQLTNILRDVDEDAAIGRLYLPRELLTKYSIDYADPATVTTQPGYAEAWREMAGHASKAFANAEAALEHCDRRKMRPARIMLEVYRRNLQRMTALSDAELASPQVSKRLVGKAEKILIALWHGIV